MPIIVQHTVQADEDDELREICLQSLESFVVRCPTEITSYLNEIIKLGLEYIKYDPNYADDDDDEVGLYFLLKILFLTHSLGG